MSKTPNHNPLTVERFVQTCLNSTSCRLSFGAVFKKGKIYTPKIWVNQPCWGELAMYTDLHGAEGGPNTYRPSDLFDPFPYVGNPYKVICRHPKNYLDGSQLDEFLSWLSSSDNPWRAGISKPKVVNGYFQTRTDVNGTVMVNFLGNYDSIITWFRHGGPSKIVSQESPWGRNERFLAKEPVLYLNEKTYEDRGNYYRGGKNYIWQDKPHSTLIGA